MTPAPRRKTAPPAIDGASTPPASPPTPRLAAIDGGAVASDVIPALDGLIHERARLAIVSALATGDAQSHTELRDLLGLTDGNLSVHARKLEEAGYIACAKEFAGRTPRTTYKLTAAGRRAFERYLAHLEQLVAAARRR